MVRFLQHSSDCISVCQWQMNQGLVGIRKPKNVKILALWLFLPKAEHPNSDSLAEFVPSLGRCSGHFPGKIHQFLIWRNTPAYIMLIGCRWLWPTAFSCLWGRTLGNLKLVAKWCLRYVYEWLWTNSSKGMSKDVKTFFFRRKDVHQNIYIYKLLICIYIYVFLHAVFCC